MRCCAAPRALRRCMWGPLGTSNSHATSRPEFPQTLPTSSPKREASTDAPSPTAKRTHMDAPKSSSISGSGGLLDGPTHFPIVCLGGGVASGYLASELVKSGRLEKGTLCIVSNDAAAPYERPILSKNYLAPENPPRLPKFYTTVGSQGECQEPAWYLEHGIAFFLNTKVHSADLKAKTLTLPSGKTIHWEKLVLATGARPIYLSDVNIPGEGLDGVMYLRTIVDADRLYDAIKKTKQAGGKAVFIGGGYIALEVAAGFATNGLPPTLVFPEPYLVPRLFTQSISEYYENFYKERGMTLMKNSKVTRLEGKDGRVTHVVVAAQDGSESKLPADLVLVAIGARANVDMFEGQLEMAVGGIKVDEHLRTSVPDVYAVGDIATFPLMMEGGEPVRQEHVTNARSTAQHLAKVLLGTAEKGYDYLPSFYSREFNLYWQFYGSKTNAETVEFGNKAEGKFGAYFVRDGKVVGAFLEGGTPDEFTAIKKVARARPAAPPAAELAQQGLGFAARCQDVQI